MSKYVSTDHESLLLYSKNIGKKERFYTPYSPEYLKRYSYEDHIGRYFWDTFSRNRQGSSNIYSIKFPNGEMVEKAWIYKEDKFKELLEKGEIRFLEQSNGNYSLQIKQRISTEGQIMRSELRDFPNSLGTERVNSLLGRDIFSYSKPIELLKYLLFPQGKKSLILDFFAGSATTADAVMQLNAEDGGNRKYMLCTLDEKVADKSAAQQAGYATIDQISRERIRRAADKIRKEQPDKAKDLDLGFRAFRVDESNFRDVSVTPSEMVQGNLLESVDNIREDATALDLLFQVMLAWGSRLSLKISEQKLEDNTIYSVDEGSLIACFDDRITEETIRALAQQKPQRAVFKDTSFTHSADKINLTQIFKEVSPETQVKVV